MDSKFWENFEAIFPINLVVGSFQIQKTHMQLFFESEEVIGLHFSITSNN